jgi:RNA polymerase sigma factor (sigma-70 family)
MDGNVASLFTEDAHLLKRARSGDAQAFETLYRAHARPLYALACRLSGDPSIAEDVVQETFVKALRSGAVFRGDAPLRSWLKRLATNAAVDRLRVESRQAQLRPDATSTPVGDAERQFECLGLLARLEPTVRAVVWLHTMEGHSHREIAAMFGNSESWSKSLVSRGLSRLRGALAEENHEPAHR